MMNKKKNKLSDAEMAAKKNVLSSLRDQAAGAMGDKLKQGSSSKLPFSSRGNEDHGVRKSRPLEHLGEKQQISDDADMKSTAAQDNHNEIPQVDGFNHDEHEDNQEMSLDDINDKLDRLLKKKNSLEGKKS